MAVKPISTILQNGQDPNIVDLLSWLMNLAGSVSSSQMGFKTFDTEESLNTYTPGADDPKYAFVTDGQFRAFRFTGALPWVADPSYFDGVAAVAQPILDAAIAASINPRSMTLSDADRNRILIAKGGVYQNPGAGLTGALKITLPDGVDARKVTVPIRFDDEFGDLTYIVSGTNNVGGWNFATARVEGHHSILSQYPDQLVVRFGNDGSNDCIFIGNVTYSYWQRLAVMILPGVSVTGNTVAEAWNGEWSISLVTAIDSVGPLVTVIPRTTMSGTNPTFAGTLNGMTFDRNPGREDIRIGKNAGLMQDTPSSYSTIIANYGGTKLKGKNNVIIGLQGFEVAEYQDGSTIVGTQSATLVNQGVGFLTTLGIHTMLMGKRQTSSIAIGPGALQNGDEYHETFAGGMYAGRDHNALLGAGGSVFLGHRAGMTYNLGGAVLKIANNEFEALLDGDFENRTLQINGSLTSEGIQFPTDNTSSVCSPTARAANIYSASPVINTSDVRHKRNIGEIPDAWLDAWTDVRWCMYLFNEGTRSHTGLVAQQVYDAFARHGIDAFDFGGCCYDKWSEETEPAFEEYDDEQEINTYRQVDPEAVAIVQMVEIEPSPEGVRQFVPKIIEPEVEVVPETRVVKKRRLIDATAIVTREAGDIWSLRYDECFSIEMAWQRREIARANARSDALETRLAALEERLAAA